jgi:hypothetical protein
MAGFQLEVPAPGGQRLDQGIGGHRGQNLIPGS